MEVAFAIWSIVFMLFAFIMLFEHYSEQKKHNHLASMSKERLLFLKKQIDEIMQCK